MNSVFDEFVAKDFTKNGQTMFRNEQTPEKQNQRAKTRDVYVAEIDNQIVGMVEATFPDHINRIFIDKKYHGKNFGKKLMSKIENIYKKKGSIKIKVYASDFAVKFYQRIGYKKTRGLVKRKFGFVYQPMKKKL
ncbi:MAG: GNAT family N-acetyltransferase [Nanoarchaeota archaeon]|nr:GNAT family N-acetyltransferase [Nanoarchaeota archaeon]